MNRIPVDCHTNNGTKKAFTSEEPLILMVIWSERGCKTVSIHFFDFNYILGLYPGLFDKRDILGSFILYIGFE